MPKDRNPNMVRVVKPDHRARFLRESKKPVVVINREKDPADEALDEMAEERLRASYARSREKRRRRRER